MSAGSEKRPPIARTWRGRTTREKAGEYEADNYEAGIKPLIEKALGVQTLREDREHESEFMTISYWESVEEMSAFAGDDPRKIHHLARDEEFLIELPKEAQILRLLTSHGVTQQQVRRAGVAAEHSPSPRGQLCCSPASSLRKKLDRWSSEM